MQLFEHYDGISVIGNELIEVAFSGKQVGNVDPRFGQLEDVEASHSKLLSVLGVGKYTVQVCQHGTHIEDLTAVATDDLEPSYEADGMLIDRSDVIVGINPADCGAIAIFAPGILAFIHAGRKGIANGIHIAAFEELIRRGVSKSDIGVIITPTIHQDSYAFSSLPSDLIDSEWLPYIDKRGSNHHVDLLGRLIDEFTNVGVDLDHMVVSPIDVGSNNAYFSNSRAHRTNETGGRNGVVARLKK